MQVTVSVTTLHVQPVPLAVIDVWPAGRVSVTLTPVATSGPGLLTVSVYAIGAPVTTVPEPVLVIERSA